MRARHGVRVRLGPGNLAGALALREAGDAAASIEIGYFAPGSSPATSLSPGTRATMVAITLEPAFAWRSGQLVKVPSSNKWRTFDLPTGRAEAISVGSTEHFTLPRLSPGLRDVTVYIGWLGGRRGRPRLWPWRHRSPPACRRSSKACSGSPSSSRRARPEGPARKRERTRARSSWRRSATRDGTLVSEVRLEGVNPYELSAELLAWGAEGAASGRLRGTGALGPVEAWGLDELEAAVAEAGMRRA